MPKPRGLVIPEPDIKRLIAGEAVTVEVGVIRKAHTGGAAAGAVLPARESGWIAWWPGWGGEKLAEFTKNEYRIGFPAPFTVGEKVYVKEAYCLQHDVEGEPPPYDDGRPIKRYDNHYTPYAWKQAHYRATDPAPDLECQRASCDNWDPHCHWTAAQRMPVE